MVFGLVFFRVDRRTASIRPVAGSPVGRPRALASIRSGIRTDPSSSIRIGIDERGRDQIFAKTNPMTVHASEFRNEPTLGAQPDETNPLSHDMPGNIRDTPTVNRVFAKTNPSPHHSPPRTSRSSLTPRAVRAKLRRHPSKDSGERMPVSGDRQGSVRRCRITGRPPKHSACRRWI